jgi:DNA polymerase-3 subunit delta
LKIESRQVAGFLRNPGNCRLVLLHGDDEGLIRERAQALTLLVAGDTHDPFRVVELTGRDGWAQLGSEMAALSMIGGRRVVRVREVSDAALEHVRAALRGPGGALAVLEAPGLGKGKLRSFVEAAPDAACIACYPEEGRAAAELIRGMFQAEGVRADPDACTWLAEVCGDRAVLRGEVEKLVLLAGTGGHVDIDMARSSAGDAAGASGDEALLAATSGDPVTADACIEKAVAEGLAGVGLIRVALMHLQKLHQARLRMEGGLSAAEAVRTLRPPVFYRAVPGMTASVNLWPADVLLRALDEARTVELACKTTGSRPDVLACRFVAALARQALARRGR